MAKFGAPRRVSVPIAFVDTPVIGALAQVNLVASLPSIVVGPTSRMRIIEATAVVIADDASGKIVLLGGGAMIFVPVAGINFEIDFPFRTLGPIGGGVGIQTSHFQEMPWLYPTDFLTSGGPSTRFKFQVSADVENTDAVLAHGVGIYGNFLIEISDILSDVVHHR